MESMACEWGVERNYAKAERYPDGVRHQHHHQAQDGSDNATGSP